MTLLFLKRLNDPLEENEEKLIQADKNEKEAYCQRTTCSQSEETCNGKKIKEEEKNKILADSSGKGIE